MALVEIEVREQDGREPTLHGVILTEGRAATGGRKELFAPGSVEWPSQGVGIATEHRGAVATRGHVTRGQDGRLSIQARATRAVVEAVRAGKRFMSVEFTALEERTTQGGVREVLRAFVATAALTANPEYDTTAAEVRDRLDAMREEALRWL